MIKSELIESLTKRQLHIPEKDIALSVNTIIALMSETLAHKDRIEIRGFGSFSVRYHPPRNAHNPRTGEKLVTEGKYSPHFKPGKALRERVNESQAWVSITEEEEETD